MRFAVGVIALLIAFAASLMLVLEHFGGMSLPGCGPGSPCAQAAASAWGKVPGLGWPTSFVGLTYFAAMLLAWIWMGGTLRALLSGVAIVGGLMSVVLTVAMVSGGYVCSYCLAVHIGNLVFVGVALGTVLDSSVNSRADSKAGAAPRSGTIPFAFAIILVTISLFAAERLVSAEVEAEAERELEQTSAALTNNTTARQPFTGRYLTGPENAPIRLVVFSDYQCPECRMIEDQLRELIAERSDMSLSAKHFPMCTMCNEHMSSNPHPNACWAARAAEAAGILRGNEGFWQMHHWLFDRRGGFTDSELHAGLQDLGYDIREFEQIMMSAETLARVQADIDEAIGLGIYFTPMIFINGVELKGWNAPNAVRRMVEQVAATNPEPAAPIADQPPSAIQKYIADWQEQEVTSFFEPAMNWPMGLEGAPIHVVMYGDFQEPNCAEADEKIRAYAARHGNLRYEFRNFPFDQSCNSSASTSKFPYGCTAAKAALAAGQLGGADSYWAMHIWLMEHQVELSDAELASAAAATNLDLTSLLSTMESSDIANAIAQDGRHARTHGLRSIPYIFINGRWAPRWHRTGEPTMLEMMLDVAGQSN